ncbi:MAG: GTP-binding protein [Variovorax sp.]|nr:GTP-binding protein [Variovorax sp.]
MNDKTAANDRNPQAIRIAVVGHTNAGKTSLLRTLTRRVDFGDVSERPGTTRHVESVDLQIDGRSVVRFFDTPGLEDAVSLRQHLDAFDTTQTPPDRIREFLRSPEAHGSFEQEAKVLRAMLEVDAAFLVIDAREPVLPKFRAEIELLNSCARPVLPVLNFVRDAASREPAWKELLSAYGLHVLVRFDAAAPFTGAERDLYRDLATLLRDRREPLHRAVEQLEAEAADRRHAAAARIAELVVDAAAVRRIASAEEFADSTKRQALIIALRQSVTGKAQRCTDDLLALYGFRQGDADEAPLQAIEGRWTLDFFEPEAMKAAGLLMGKGVVAGAAVGVVADLALAGLSLGAGAALGGAIGGAVSQGWGPFGRKLANMLRDVQELSIEDSVLVVVAAWQLQLAQALERRGHAATERIAVGSTVNGVVAAAVRAARPARSHPEWESTRRLRWTAAAAARDALVEHVAKPLEAALSS